MPLFSKSSNNESTPICRCRVLYLGSAVPHVTKDGLQGIQEPLRELYPEQGALGARGIDSWLSVWSNGLLLENVDENHKKVTRFFPIDSLHYCAAVRYVLVPEKSSNGASSQPRFLPLDSPFARSPNPTHPPLFAAILRRTTGIKVLECHTFICKREAAANALVRCCFHAYADSSYAKQMIENATGNGAPTTNGGTSSLGGGSLYGTLCNGAVGQYSIDKVEGWRRQASNVRGSSLTLNSTVRQSPSRDEDEENNEETSRLELSNSADDLSSIYNGGGVGVGGSGVGDENHKIWVGSRRDLSGDRDAALYGGDYNGSTMRSSRSSRPRQNVNAPPPPPPPVKEEKSKKKDRPTRRKKMSEGTAEEMYYMLNGNGGSLMRPGSAGAFMKSSSSVSGGTMLRSYPPKYYPSASSVYSGAGTILRPASSPSVNGFHQGPPLLMVPTATLPHHPPRRLSAGSSYTGKKQPPLMVPVPMVPQPAPNFLPIQYLANGGGGGKKSKHQPPMMIPAVEEPIYMPSARPMSPIASYQPGHFPHEAYLMQQYANACLIPNGSIENGKSNKKKKKNGKSSSKKKSSSASLMDPGQQQQLLAATPATLLVPSDGGVNSDDIIDNEDDDLEAESIYNSGGIYRRKGHLNERAFSYSIRQEHRSRSYGSLANLKFAPPPVIPNGNMPASVALDHQNVPVNKQELKKEREIMQMMNDLRLSNDELERSQVPQPTATVYQQHQQQQPQQQPQQQSNKMRVAKIRK